MELERAREIVAVAGDADVRQAAEYCADVVSAVDPDRVGDERLVATLLQALATLVLHGRSEGHFHDAARHAARLEDEVRVAAPMCPEIEAGWGMMRRFFDALAGTSGEGAAFDDTLREPEWMKKYDDGDPVEVEAGWIRTLLGDARRGEQWKEIAGHRGDKLERYAARIEALEAAPDDLPDALSRAEVEKIREGWTAWWDDREHESEDGRGCGCVECESAKQVDALATSHEALRARIEEQDRRWKNWSDRQDRKRDQTQRVNVRLRARVEELEGALGADAVWDLLEWIRVYERDHDTWPSIEAIRNRIEREGRRPLDKAVTDDGEEGGAGAERPSFTASGAPVDISRVRSAVAHLRTEGDTEGADAVTDLLNGALASTGKDSDLTTALDEALAGLKRIARDAGDPTDGGPADWHREAKQIARETIERVEGTLGPSRDADPERARRTREGIEQIRSIEEREGRRP